MCDNEAGASQPIRMQDYSAKSTVQTKEWIEWSMINALTGLAITAADINIWFVS